MKIQKQSSNKKWVAVVIAVAALLVAGGAAYALTRPRSNSQSIPTIQDSPAQTTPTDASPNTTEPSQSNNSPASVEFSKLLPYDSDHFGIQKTQAGFEVSLYAILNNPSQYDAYIAQLKQYKQEALAYITSKGFDPATLPLTYSPEEAKDY